MVVWYRAICDEALGHQVSVTVVETSLDLIATMDRKNLFTSIHLNQELRTGNADRLADIVQVAGDVLSRPDCL